MADLSPKSIADELASEVDTDAELLSVVMAPEFEDPGMHELARKDYLVMVKDMWPDVNFRTNLLDRVGDEEFLRIALEAHGEPFPAWLTAKTRS